MTNEKQFPKTISQLQFDYGLFTNLLRTVKFTNFPPSSFKLKRPILPLLTKYVSWLRNYLPYQAKIFLVSLTPKEFTPCKISHICHCTFNVLSFSFTFSFSFAFSFTFSSSWLFDSSVLSVKIVSNKSLNKLNNSFCLGVCFLYFISAFFSSFNVSKSFSADISLIVLFIIFLTKSLISVYLNSPIWCL